MRKKSFKLLEILAAKVEDRYGPKTRDRIFGDIPKLPVCEEKDAAWLQRFVCGINDLNDVDFTNVIMKNMHHIVRKKPETAYENSITLKGVCTSYLIRYFEAWSR